MDNNIIDLELGKKLINGGENRARDMLTMLMDMLPEHEKGIKAAHDDSNHDAFVAEVHKFRGGVCYCGTPELQETTTALEIALKKGEKDIDSLYEKMLAAIENFKNSYKKL
jgi:HPt (histidine-containing phosphotransfer) domain-containing protein